MARLCRRHPTRLRSSSGKSCRITRRRVNATPHAPRKLEESVALAGPYRDQRLLGLRKGVDVFRRTPTLLSVVRGPVAAALRLLKQLPRLTGESGPYRMLLFAGDHAVLP